MTQKLVTKWRLTDSNIPVAERTFDREEDARAYLRLAWTVYPNMHRVRLSRYDITTEVITRPAEPDKERLAPMGA